MRTFANDTLYKPSEAEVLVVANLVTELRSMINDLQLLTGRLQMRNEVCTISVRSFRVCEAFLFALFKVSGPCENRQCKIYATSVGAHAQGCMVCIPYGVYASSTMKFKLDGYQLTGVL